MLTATDIMRQLIETSGLDHFKDEFGTIIIEQPKKEGE